MIPLTASASLARRIDRTEFALAREAAEGARRLGRDGVQVLSIGGTAAILAEPGSPFNKLIGLGFGEPVDEGILAEVERVHAERNVPLQVELAALADPRVGRLLTRRGYVLAGFENLLGRALEAPLPDANAGSVAIAPVSPGEERKWIDTVATAFLHEDSYDGPAAHQSFTGSVIERAFESCMGAPGFRWFMAQRDGEPAGGGSLYVKDGIAVCAGAATLPHHRQKGVQAALLVRRLQAARELGCDLAVVTTTPGSKSQVNVQRLGFQLLYTRAILVREANG